MTHKEFKALLKIQGYDYRIWPYPQSAPRDVSREPLWIAEVIDDKTEPFSLVSYAVGTSEKEAVQSLIKVHYANNRK